MLSKDIISDRAKYKNIFWFLIDGLRPDFLHLNDDAKQCNFIDRCLLRGTVFTNVVTAGAGTHTSMHSIFTSLLPSYNGAVGYEKSALRNFRQEIFTISDYFQLAGYETFRYGDADLERACPMTGFKRWEGSGYHIGNILKHTDLTKTERRDRFIEDVNVCHTNKFVYHHSLLLHELNGESGTFWSSENYAKNIEITAKEFEKLYYEYSISEDDLVIIASDHGVLLNRDYIHDVGENKGHHHEESVKAFFCLIGKDIPAQILMKPISALDEAPTILHMALGKFMPGQGEDRYDYIYGGEYRPAVCFRESGLSEVPPSFEEQLNSNFYYLRDGKWKYTFCGNYPQCEWLIDLEDAGDFQINLKYQYPDERNKYHEMIKRKFSAAQDFHYLPGLSFEKAEIAKEFSLILQVEHIQEQTIKSILDMSGPYYEVFLPHSKISEQFKDNYKVCLINTLDEASIRTFSRGKWLVYLTENGEYSEYFLSDLNRYIQHHRQRNVKIIGEHYIALRREESQDFCGVELYETMQVRAIRYLHPEIRANTYILFGCGMIGKEALEYFGAENVFCFVDNDPAKVGKRVRGKEVISAQHLLEIYSKYKIVITTEPFNAQAIEMQLIKMGIQEYFLLRESFRENRTTCWDEAFELVSSNKIQALDNKK